MKVCVLGAGGFIGKNLLRGTDWVGVTRQELDLTDIGAVEKYFEEHEYDVVIHCAVIGGSRLKPDDGEVFYKNLLMFESVTRAFKGRILYFSSGAALRVCPHSYRSQFPSLYPYLDGRVHKCYQSLYHTYRLWH
jgi:nucleoside-diphosphate-sugar epimerase